MLFPKELSSTQAMTLLSEMLCEQFHWMITQEEVYLCSVIELAQ